MVTCSWSEIHAGVSLKAKWKIFKDTAHFTSLIFHFGLTSPSLRVKIKFDKFEIWKHHKYKNVVLKGQWKEELRKLIFFIQNLHSSFEICVHFTWIWDTRLFYSFSHFFTPEWIFTSVFLTEVKSLRSGVSLHFTCVYNMWTLCIGRSDFTSLHFANPKSNHTCNHPLTLHVSILVLY